MFLFLILLLFNSIFFKHLFIFKHFLFQYFKSSNLKIIQNYKECIILTDFKLICKIQNLKRIYSQKL